MVRQYEYQPCIPTRGTKVPAGPDWLHEIKHDGYRLIVQREGKRVRLFTRNGYDWRDRYPLITEAARYQGVVVPDRWRGLDYRRRWRMTSVRYGRLIAQD